MEEEKVVVPDSVTPIIGWRFWKVRQIFDFNKEEKFLLRSATTYFEWPEKAKAKAECFCFERDHPFYHKNCPEQGSSCGIYAYKSANFALSDFNGRLSVNWGNNYSKHYLGGLLGKVYLWGKIQKHQFGFRAQFAYPFSVNFIVCGGCWEIFPVKSVLMHRAVKKAVKKELVDITCNSYESEFICSACMALLERFVGHMNIIRSPYVLERLKEEYGMKIDNGVA